MLGRDRRIAPCEAIQRYICTLIGQSLLQKAPIECLGNFEAAVDQFGPWRLEAMELQMILQTEPAIPY
jgi:hypothetical protein